jgi:ketosteroid isomerase-like protein
VRRPYLFSGPLLLLAACGQSAEPEAVLETVRMTGQAQYEAIAAKDLQGAMRVYAHDAVLTGHGAAPATGADAIRAAFADRLADPNHAVEVTPGAAWAAASGDMAVTTSSVRVTRTDPASGQPVTVPVETQTVWRKAQGLPWQIVAEQHTQRPAAPAD